MSADGIPQRTVYDTAKIFIKTEVKPLCRTQYNIILSFGILDYIPNVVSFNGFEYFIEVICKFLSGDPLHSVKRL